MIDIGADAPDFKLPGTEGGEIEPYRLSEYTEDGAAVLVFYPFDFSPVCTEELCTFRDAEWLTMTPEIDVFGISTDSCYAHKRFIDEYELAFPLLSDTCGEVTEAYGVAYDEWEHHQGVPKRALVTIDDQQTIDYTWVTENAYESPSLSALHDSLTTLTATPHDARSE